MIGKWQAKLLKRLKSFQSFENSKNFKSVSIQARRGGGAAPVRLEQLIEKADLLRGQARPARRYKRMATDTKKPRTGGTRFNVI
jgi:hypothetical protein